MSSDGIKYVRRPENKRYDVRDQVPTVKHGGGNVMVWRCFWTDGVGPLVRITGRMDRFSYERILREHMLPHVRETMPSGWLFQYDNDPKHTSKHVKKVLKAEKVRVLPWPSQSPDLNPIEHLWEELDRRFRTQNFSSKDAFFAAFQAEWAKIPLSVFQKLVRSYAKGYATKY